MIILNVMITKKTMGNENKKQGFTLLELLVAMVIFTAIFLSILGLVSNLQLTQKKIVVANDFYDESRLLMERVVQKIRNNTIDYDRYHDRYHAENNSGNYEDKFYQSVGGKMRNTGMGPEAFSGAQEELYLINPERTVRTAIRVNTESSDDVPDGALEIQTQLGSDDDGDGKIDIWSESATLNGDACQISSEGDNYDVVLGSATDVNLFCARVHDWTVISPNQISITAPNSPFILGPSKDPYLAFKDDTVQQQPFVRFAFEMVMRDPNRYGFESDEVPEIYLQTAASSRVFGNTR